MSLEQDRNSQDSDDEHMMAMQMLDSNVQAKAKAAKEKDNAARCSQSTSSWEGHAAPPFLDIDLQSESDSDTIFGDKTLDEMQEYHSGHYTSSDEERPEKQARLLRMQTSTDSIESLEVEHVPERVPYHSVDECTRGWYGKCNGRLQTSIYGDRIKASNKLIEQGLDLYTEFSGSLAAEQACDCINHTLREHRTGPQSHTPFDTMRALKAGDKDKTCQQFAVHYQGEMQPHCQFGSNLDRMPLLMKEEIVSVASDLNDKLITAIGRLKAPKIPTKVKLIRSSIFEFKNLTQSQAGPAAAGLTFKYVRAQALPDV